MTKTSTRTPVPAVASIAIGDAATTIGTLCGHPGADDTAISTACGDYVCADDACLYAHLDDCRACIAHVVAAADLY